MTRVLLTTIVVLLFGTAQAEPYAVAGLGAASETTANGGTDSTLPLWIGAGYSSGPWSAEATYANLGKVERVVSTGTTNLSERDWTGKGVGLFGVRHIGSFLVRAGAYRLHSESRVRTPGPLDLGEPRSETIWAPSLGIGWETKLSQRVTARLSAEYVRGRGDFENARIGGFSLLYGF